MLSELNVADCSLPLALNNTAELGPTILSLNVVLLLNVLAPAIVWLPLVLTTVESTSILSVPDVPPPLRPSPAVTPCMSPSSVNDKIPVALS